jgi:hypothetical protein
MIKERLRQGPAEYFNVFTRHIIPQLEQRIEERLLHEFMNDLKSPEERNEVYNAYYMRRHNLTKLREEADLFDPNDKGDGEDRIIDGRELKGVISGTDGDGFKYHTFADLGKFTLFPQSVRDRIFPSRCYGRIDMTDVEHSKTLGVQCREESLRLTNDMARLTLPSERQVDYLRIGSGEIPKRELKTEVI